jgi:hypothetical protein
MNERCQHMPIRWELHQPAPVHTCCSPYQGPRIDIFRAPPAHLTEYQSIKEHTSKSSLLHIPPSISQNTSSRPSFNSPYRGRDLDITGGTILKLPESQSFTSSAVHTTVLHIAPPTQHTGAHRRQQPAFRVSDRSGTPQAGNPAEEYSGERDPRLCEGHAPKNTNEIPPVIR